MTVTLPDVAPNAGLGRLYYAEFTIPAGTPVASPVSLAFPLEDNFLKAMYIRIPPGPSGYMGFKILWASQQIVPWGNNSWLITNDEKVTWESETAVTVSGLVLEGYNTGQYNHTIYVLGLIQTLTPQLLQTVTELTGSVSAPGSQIGPETATINTMTAPELSESGTEAEETTGTEETPSAELPPGESELQIPQEEITAYESGTIPIGSGISLVGST